MNNDVTIIDIRDLIKELSLYYPVELEIFIDDKPIRSITWEQGGASSWIVLRSTREDDEGSE